VVGTAAVQLAQLQGAKVVGTASDCQLRLTDAAVSRRHAWLTFRDGHWVLRDLDSTNGTCVNGEHVERCVLEPGDRLRLGSAELVVD